MADNEEPKKESLDEILSDLNAILNKMPDILDGVKPAEAAPAQPAAEPVAGMDASGDLERVIDLNDLGRAEKPADAAGGKISAAPQADAADKTLVIQSLGESMFSGDAQEPAQAPQPAEPEPAAQEPQAPAQPEVPALPSAETAVPAVENKAAGEELKAEAPGSVEALIMDFKSDAPVAKKEEAAHAGSGLYACTRDFGVPDIDMLLAMSQGEPPKAAEAPAPSAEAAPQAETPAPLAGQVYAEELKGIDGLIIGQEPAPENIQAEGQQEEQPAVEAGVPAAGPLAVEGGAVEFKEEDLKKEEAPQTPAPEAAGAPERSGQSGAQEPAGIIGFGPEEAPAPQPEEEKPMTLPPSGEPPQAEPFLVPGSAEPAQAQAEPAIVLGNAEPVPAPGGPSLELGNAEVPLELSVAQPSPQPEEEKTMLILPSGAPQAEPSLELGNALPDLSINPPSPAPEEEKTMMIAPGTDLGAPDFGATTRSRADLAELSAKAMPESIPENRQRILALLYAEEDKDLCASVLAELDSICARSQSKPMFIKRAFVKICEVGMNGNLVQQMAVDAKANGLVCVGSIPQETVYEIENAVSSSGLMFKHVQRDNFSHSAMLDVVTELILK